MRKLFLTLLFITFFSCIARSQEGKAGVGLDLGYIYNRKSWGNIGVSGSYCNSLYGDNKWHLGGGAGVNLAFNKGYKHHIAGYVNGGFGFLFEGKVSFSKYYLNPAVGINFGNYGKLHLGYSIPMSSMNGFRIKGFTLGFVVTFGTSGYYTVKMDW